MSVPSLSTTGLTPGATNLVSVIAQNFQNLINYFNGANIDTAQLAKPYSTAGKTFTIPGAPGAGTWNFYFQVPSGQAIVHTGLTLAAQAYAAVLAVNVYYNGALQYTATAAAGVAPQPAGWVSSPQGLSFGSGSIVRLEVISSVGCTDVTVDFQYKTLCVS